jgi:hypothetical protein
MREVRSGLVGLAVTFLGAMAVGCTTEAPPPGAVSDVEMLQGGASPEPGGPRGERPRAHAAGAIAGLRPGTWSGTYANTFETHCRFEDAGTLKVTIGDAGASTVKQVRIDGLQIRTTSRNYGHASACFLLDTMSTTGTSETIIVDGETARGVWTFVDDAYGKLEWPWTARITAEGLIGTWACAGCSGGFTLKHDDADQ